MLRLGLGNLLTSMSVLGATAASGTSLTQTNATIEHIKHYIQLKKESVTLVQLFIRHVFHASAIWRPSRFHLVMSSISLDPICEVSAITAKREVSFQREPGHHGKLDYSTVDGAWPDIATPYISLLMNKLEVYI